MDELTAQQRDLVRARLALLQMVEVCQYLIGKATDAADVSQEIGHALCTADGIAKSYGAAMRPIGFTLQ